MRLSGPELVVYAEQLDLACSAYLRAIEESLAILRGLDGTTFTFPEPRRIIDRAIQKLESASTLHERVPLNAEDNTAIRENVLLAVFDRATKRIDELEVAVRELRAALVDMSIPYAALLMDEPSRKWIAPKLWDDMTTARDRSLTVLTSTARLDT